MTKTYLIICYAVHDQEIASIDQRNNWEDAVKFLKEDVANVYEDEVNGSGTYLPNGIRKEIDETRGTGKVNNDDEYIWTWEIKEICLEGEKV